MKVFAFYLPQFYPIPENDEFWGKGFTEWRNVVTAKKYFPGHKQPRLPKDLGFYDLRCVETIEQQATYAREYGLSGFAFWHYWFGNGKRALDRPANILLANPHIDVEYYFTWVNADWTGSWVGENDRIIFKQSYDSESDYIDHFNYVLPFFKDRRYYKIDNRPVFAINTPRDFDASVFIKIFEAKARENGFSGITWVAPLNRTGEPQLPLFQYLTGYPPADFDLNFSLLNKLKKRLRINRGPRLIDYPQYVSRYKTYINRFADNRSVKYVPVFMPNWDNTPRYGRSGTVFINGKKKSMTDLFSFLYAYAATQNLPFMLIKAWNEWAEGNYMEPDTEDEIGLIVRKVIKAF